MGEIENNTVVVKKFGGTSLNDIGCLKHAAQLVQEAQLRGEQPLVVVSAMGGVTNQLVQWAENCCVLNMDATKSELDTVITSGEQVTSGLMALALQDLGCRAASFLGWQLPILTDEVYRNAEIVSINTLPLQNYMATGGIPVVAGFQGITKLGRISSLGRGGSDTTAVALSALLKARLCQIFTDVDGVYNADPACIQDAQKFDRISYEDMTTFSRHGAKILHDKALQWARRYKVPIQVLSTFAPENPGTYVCEFVSGNAKGIAHKGVLCWKVPGLSRIKAEQLLQVLQNQLISVWGWQRNGSMTTFFTEMSAKNNVQQYVLPTVSILPHTMFTMIGVSFDDVPKQNQQDLRRMGVEYIFRSVNSISYVVQEQATMKILSVLHKMVQT
ncbi:aspartate kinase [Holospora curviuscula]|uniref:Aspartokinase n=1 Tax=Holospora curviuscula TaxID=1082868 RepID=A0A2S5RA36_9PROT|nr:aspartate kinase [Holospora curviuscula]PPE04194.1 Aspartokinase [Holospora curviuscula]